MCEIPSNVILAAAFAERFDGFSIGSNDLTQLTLGVDRDSELLASVFDEQDEAVKWMIRSVIQEARKAGAKVGLCGQAPSDHPEFAEFLVECGIDSISVVPDSFISVKKHVAEAEIPKKLDVTPRNGVQAMHAVQGAFPAPLGIARHFSLHPRLPVADVESIPRGAYFVNAEVGTILRNRPVLNKKPDRTRK